MDPVMLERLWLAVRPIKRWKEHRAKRKQQPQETPAMSETTQIYARGALKLIAGGLAMKAGLDATDATALQAALEAIVGGLAALVGFYLSHRKVKP